MSLEITASLHQSAFLAGLAQTIYALLDFQPAGVAGRVPLDLRLVLDVSGSMSMPAQAGGRESKLELLKEAVDQLIGRLEVGDRLMIVTFDDSAETIYDGTIQDQAQIKKARKAIARVRCGGGTAMAVGLEAALVDAPLPDRTTRLVVVTDGETYGQDRCAEIAFEQQGETTWLIYGVGVSYDDAFLDRLATLNGGQFAHMSDLDEAQEIFCREVEVMGEIAIKQLVVSVEPGPGVAIARADRIVPQLLPVGVANPTFLSVDLGDVDRARGQKLLLQLTVPAMAPGDQPLAVIKAGYHVPVRKLLNQTSEITLLASFTPDEAAILPDGDVNRTIQLAGASRLTTMGMAEAASGQGAQGARTLASAAAIYQALGREDLSTKMKTLTSALSTQGRIGADAEDTRRTLTTMARQAWEDPDA